MELDNLKSFISVLTEYSEKCHLETYKQDVDVLKMIGSELCQIQQDKDEFDRLNASHFNVFRILRYGHYETRLHTPILADLLNPKGYHQLKDLFFIQMVRHVYNFNFQYEELSDITISEELVTDHLDGRIDIFIRFKYDGKYFHCAIENKINADDQPEQLERYWHYLEKQSMVKDRLKLVYLTKHGTSPSGEKSIKKEVLDNLIEMNVYMEMSHSKHISFFLENILNNTDIPRSVYYSLQQYKQILLDF